MILFKFSEIYKLFYKYKIFFLRIICYEKPYRVGIIKYLSLKFKKFRPHYECILFEACYEAKKLDYKEVSVLELGVAGGNGIIALEKYKTKMEKIFNIKINIYGFDSGNGLPKPLSVLDPTFLWQEGKYKIDKKKIELNTNSKIFFGDIRNTIDDFANYYPKNIISIFFDLDLYSSTKSFLDQLFKLEKFLCPRVYCFFDNIFNINHYLNKFNGELGAINEFNKTSLNMKLACSLDNLNDYKFPLAKNMLYILHNFNHKDYNKYINESESDLEIDNNKAPSIL
jgi:hypothetical protein